MSRLLFALCLLFLSGAALAESGQVAVPEPSEKALAYYYTRNVLWAAGLLLALAVPALVLFTGWSARIRDRARRVSARWPAVLLIYLATYGAIEFVAGLPLAYYGAQVVEQRFGLSEQALGKWLADSLIALAVGIVIGYVVMLGIYKLLRASPRRWWLYGGIASVPFLFFLIFVTPVWIEPLFNKFGPMQDKALEARIVALAHRSGIDAARVYEVEKSVDTKKMNAYVSGFAGTQRIVMWDTTIRKLDERQLLFVMGHEMGHYVLGHGWKIVLFVSVLITLALYAAHRLSHGLIARFAPRFGFDRLDDVASYPLIAIVAGIVFFVCAPVANAFIRHLEHEADRFGLEITRDNHAAASAFAKMGAENLANPRPNRILHWLRDSHPATAERIEFSNTYKPWETGAPLVYADRFK